MMLGEIIARNIFELIEIINKLLLLHLIGCLLLYQWYTVTQTSNGKIFSRGAGHRWHNTANAHCNLDNYGYRHTLRTCNIYCYFTAAVVTRKRLNVTLYVICLSVCLSLSLHLMDRNCEVPRYVVLSTFPLLPVCSAHMICAVFSNAVYPCQSRSVKTQLINLSNQLVSKKTVGLLAVAWSVAKPYWFVWLVAWHRISLQVGSLCVVVLWEIEACVPDTWPLGTGRNAWCYEELHNL